MTIQIGKNVPLTLPVDVGEHHFELVYRHMSQDGYVLDTVLKENCYQLPDRFPEQSVVIDVGANIGAFTFACLIRGAFFVDAYEIQAENCRWWERNLAPLAHSCRLQEKAVWRAGQDQVRLKDRSPWTAQHHIWREGPLIPAISLDEILAQYSRVYLVKLDCEGAEYPILYTSKLLDRVENLTMEYHPQMVLTHDLSTNPQDLRKFLEEQGFQVRDVPGNEHPDLVGVFFCTRSPS